MNPPEKPPTFLPDEQGGHAYDLKSIDHDSMTKCAYGCGCEVYRWRSYPPTNNAMLDPTGRCPRNPLTFARLEELLKDRGDPALSLMLLVLRDLAARLSQPLDDLAWRLRQIEERGCEEVRRKKGKK